MLQQFLDPVEIQGRDPTIQQTIMVMVNPKLRV